MGGVLCLSSQVSPTGRGGQSVSPGFSGLCSIVSSHAISATIKTFTQPCFSVFPTSLVCPAMLPHIYTLHTHLHCPFCGVVQPPVSQCHAVFFSLLPNSKCNKAKSVESQALYRPAAGLHCQAELLKILQPFILGVCHFFPSLPFLCVLLPHRSLLQRQPCPQLPCLKNKSGLFQCWLSCSAFPVARAKLLLYRGRGKAGYCQSPNHKCIYVFGDFCPAGLLLLSPTLFHQFRINII